MIPASLFYLRTRYFQFLPVLGHIVSDAIEGKLDPAVAQRFAVDRKHSTADQFDPSRGLLRPVELTTESLCAPEDLLPCLDKNVPEVKP
jgi:sarcosine oxidase/L-pipecolate oxidase